MLTFFVKRDRNVQHVKDNVQILTVESPVHLGSGLRWGKVNVPCFFMRNQSVPVKNYWADVQLCFVRVR